MFDKFFKRFKLFSNDNNQRNKIDKLSEGVSNKSKSKDTSGYMECISGFVLSRRKLEIGKPYTKYHDFINFKSFLKSKDASIVKFAAIEFLKDDITSGYAILKKHEYLCKWEILREYNHLYRATISCLTKDVYHGEYLTDYDELSIPDIRIEEELDIVQTLHNNGKFKYLYDLDEIQDYDSYEDYMTNEFFNWLMSKSYINIIMDELKNKYECEEDRCKKLDQICDTILNLFNANENLNSLDTIAFLLR